MIDNTTMKKTFAIIFSLLLVFLMAPVLPGSVYADSDFTDGVQEFYRALDTSNQVKIPGSGLEAVPGGAKAGPTAVTTNSFHDSTLPNDGWISIDSDGDGYGWGYAKDTSPSFWSMDGKDGECITSASFVNYVGPLTPDNWLVSPAVKVPANSQIQFYAGGQDADYCAEHFGVYISTTSQTDTSSFTKLYEATVTRGSGGFDGVAVDLTAYAGQTVYIAVRHFNVTDMYYLNLDGMGFAAAGTDPGNIEQPASPPTIKRVKGKNRYSTSLAIALEILEYMPSNWKYPNAIIATGDNFPDALAGSALSTAVAAPILLISDKVPSSIENAVNFIESHVNPEGYVFILGGKGAVPESVEEMLGDIGFKTQRFAGKNRYETNIQVLSLLYQANGNKIENLLVCDGTNWPDAATASALGRPIMLVPKTGLSADQKDLLSALSNVSIDVIGGKGAVSQDIYNALGNYTSALSRISGANRAETAVEVAKNFLTSANVTVVCFAYAANFPDCISGGLLAYASEAPILYGDSKAPKTYVDADVPYLAETGAWSAFVFGGESLISDEFITDLFLATLELQ